MSRARPVLRWHGGKWMLAPWIIANMPPHRIYVEPYGGAASVLLRKERAHAEVWNDLDGDLHNLFQVLRSDTACDLIKALQLTPFSRDEFVAARVNTTDPVERARRLVVRSFMGFGSNSCTKPTGFRANSSRSGTTPAGDWANYPEALLASIKRLEGVIIENRDAKLVMKAHDGPNTTHFVDPPYLASTRNRGADYTHELSEADHAELLAFLETLQGSVLLCGYPSKLYDDALSGWQRIERPAMACGARPRTEVLWINRP
jgi:DNA adenine methylase